MQKSIFFENNYYDVGQLYDRAEPTHPGLIVGFMQDNPSGHQLMQVGRLMGRDPQQGYYMVNNNVSQISVWDVWHVIPLTNNSAYHLYDTNSNHPNMRYTNHIDKDDCCFWCCVLGWMCCDD